jgi:hypothetical protein
LDKDSYECYFGHGKCDIWFKDACVGITPFGVNLILLDSKSYYLSVGMLVVSSNRT